VLIGLGVIGWSYLSVRVAMENGFYSDDWWLAYRAEAGGLARAIPDANGNRPLLWVLLLLTHVTFGDARWAFHAFSALTVATATGLFYLVLLELGLTRRDACGIGVLALLFPWATAVRFWPTGAVNNVAIILFFCGFLAAMQGLRAGGRRGAALHVGALVCYAASLLTYEAALLVIAFTWLAYRRRYGSAAGWRWRGMSDVAIAAAVTAYGALTWDRPVVGVADGLHSAGRMAVGGTRLLLATFIPVIRPEQVPWAVAFVSLGISVAVGGFVFRRLNFPRKPAGHDVDVASAAVLGVAALAVVLSWAMFLPGGGYAPDRPGTGNRVNVLALYPLSVLVYSCVAWATSRSPSERRRAVTFPIVITALAAIYLAQGFIEQAQWASAARAQRRVLAAITRAAPAHGDLVLTFGHPAHLPPGIPIFEASWDLFPAVRLITRDQRLEAYPVFRGAVLRCDRGGVRIRHLPSPTGAIDPRGNGYALQYPYGRITLVDVSRGASVSPSGARDCTDALRRFRPGPFVGQAKRGPSR
jgi:hypothetical protein